MLGDLRDMNVNLRKVFKMNGLRQILFMVVIGKEENIGVRSYEMMLYIIFKWLRKRIIHFLCI